MITISDTYKSLLQIEVEKKALDKESECIHIQQATLIANTTVQMGKLSQQQEIIMQKRIELDETMFALLRNTLRL